MNKSVGLVEIISISLHFETITEFCGMWMCKVYFDLIPFFEQYQLFVWRCPIFKTQRISVLSPKGKISFNITHPKIKYIYVAWNTIEAL